MLCILFIVYIFTPAFRTNYILIYNCVIDSFHLSRIENKIGALTALSLPEAISILIEIPMTSLLYLDSIFINVAVDHRKLRS